jgi:hypothetical protein
VWILRLVGDAHQPLQAAARYTLQIPDGDAGGNAESVIPASGWSIALRAYWNAIFAGCSSPYAAIFDADDKDGLSSVGVSGSCRLGAGGRGSHQAIRLRAARELRKELGLPQSQPRERRQERFPGASCVGRGQTRQTHRRCVQADFGNFSQMMIWRTKPY